MSDEAAALDDGSRPIRVVIVDDHALFRRGLDLVLSEEPDIEIVGEAGDGVEAVTRTQELLPDIVLMDVRMPRATGIDAARAIRDTLPDTKVIMLTVSEDEDDLYEAVKAGANGYLLKEVAIEEVADAVRSVARGHSLISPSMASKLLSEFNVLARRAEERQRVMSPRLTDRELEVLKLVAKGLSNREIASELFIAENTVKNHVRNILEKLHLHSRMEAVVYAMREKLFDVD
ncbi:MAG TPA: response regulator transcription factor [Acidimicrobiia bacterium]|nr:response regulator transcription factor [Acidimicrobiia bacterium]